ncbi:hypothetical protein AYI69_g4187 [Smittium culicis]|uniref:Uncharacterized protein n=1 Tax=Smittium culicis TaxID=133412 RepID=A0A1R1YFS9_9FUNG|nr:hypothetical protein AYI69_g4187 [Smittium culicis]
MDQIPEAQTAGSQEQLKVLTEMLQQLLCEKERNQDQELTEALPSIEEDFFLLPLAEEERKIAIHSCPKTSSMNYIPPPLNDSASSTVKKAVSATYGIRLALAQATRPIDYYVHRRFQESSRINTKEDHGVIFASTMRELELPGKPTQLVESDTKPLMDQEALDALIAKKPATKCQRIQLFHKLQQNTTSKDSYSSNSVTAPSTSTATSAEAVSSNKTIDRLSNFRGRGRGRPEKFYGQSILTPSQEIHREDTSQGFWILQPLKSEPARRGTEFQDRNSQFHLQNDSKLGLADIHGPLGRIHAYLNSQHVQKIASLTLEWSLFPIFCDTIRAVVETTAIYQDSAASSEMGQVQWDSISCLPGSETKSTANKDSGLSTRGKQITECWKNYIEMSCKLHRKNPSDFDRPATLTPYAPPTSGTLELLPEDDEIMDVDGHFDETCHPETIFLEEQADDMERALIIARDTRIGSVIRFQRLSMGNSSGTSHAEECGWSLGVSLLRKHDHTSICKEVWRNEFPRIAQYSRTNMESLSENEHETPSYICSLGTHSSRCSEQINRTDRMVSFTREIQHFELDAWPTRFELVCIPAEQEVRGLLNLVPRYEGIRPERTEIQLMRMSNNDSGNANVEVSNLAPRPHGPVNLTTTPPASNNAHTRSEKRKVSALDK